MVEDAWKGGNKYRKDTVIVEASSGNTGISIASIAPVGAPKCVIVILESSSEEERILLELLVVRIVLVSKGIKGAYQEG